MNKLLSISILGLLLIITTGLNISITHAQTAPVAGTECSNATQFVTITAGPGIKYDKSSITVSKSTCVQITLVNQDTLVHDFVIDSISGEAGIEQVYMKTDIGETAHFNVTTPNVDVIFEFYCWEPGHKAAGMLGDFVVGTGQTVTEIEDFSSSTTIEESNSEELQLPSFNLFLSLNSILTIVVVRNKLKNKK